jgi:ATP-dependent Clp protease ATP-binding subunit ClpA
MDSWWSWRKKLQDNNAALAEIQKNESLLKEEVDEQDIAAVVSRWDEDSFV